MISPRELLDLLGIEYWERTNRLSFRCIWHHDIDPSAAFYLDTELAHCFSCSYTLDMVAFYAKYQGQRYFDAKQALERQFGEQRPKQRPDEILISKRRSAGEKLLKDLRHLDRKEHATHGERLDKVIVAYERGQIDQETFERAYEGWRGKLP